MEIILLLSLINFLHVATISGMSTHTTIPDQQSSCGSWIPYTDQKCVLIADIATFQTKEEAEAVCPTFAETEVQDDVPRLVTVCSATEQKALKKILFEDLELLDHVWIGLDSGNDGILRWNTGSELYLDNLADQNVTGTDRQCVQMESGQGIYPVGQWVRVNCRKRNVVVCEKTQTWTIAKLQRSFLNFKSRVERQIEKSPFSFGKELKKTSNSEVPKKITGLTYSLGNSPCGDWMPYKNEKCIKSVKEAGLQTKVESEIVCQTFAEKLYIDDVPKLVTVETQEKQLFLEKLLFEEMIALDNVWLGLDLGEDDQFRWNNRSDLFFSNWVDESRTDKEHRCVQMKSGEVINERGKWLKVNCNKKGAIVCERIQPWSIIALQDVLLSLKLEVIKNNQAWKQKLNDAKKEAEEANLKIAEANQEIARIKQNPVPVGFIYIQLPGQAPPTTLWPQTSWKDVGSNYSGLFFRAEGGDAAPFGQLQEDNTRSLAGVYFFSGFNDLDNDPLIPSDGSWSTYVKSGLDGSGSLIGLRFRLNSGEVRPRNKSVKIWQRIN